MFGRQASSPSRTGTLLLVMVALVSGVHLTESTSMASDNVGGVMAKNVFASSNLTGRGLSMSRSFDAPPKGRGLTLPSGFTVPSGMPPVPSGMPPIPVPSAFLQCNVPCATPEGAKKEIECIASYKPPTIVNGSSELCDFMHNLGQCCMDAACTCPDANATKKISDDIFEILKDPIICGDKAKHVSCSSNLLWIILAVVGGVIVVIVVIGVVVCCCCMGGGGRKHSKHSSKGSSKGKLNKGSSKRRGTSRH